MKKKFEMESCCKCNESKSILKEIYFYGKLSYLCLDCKNLEVSKSSLTQSKIYKIPSFLIGKNTLLFGSEGFGLRTKTLMHSDFQFKVRINKNMESLNISNSVAVVCHYIDNLINKNE